MLAVAATVAAEGQTVAGAEETNDKEEKRAQQIKYMNKIVITFQGSLIKYYLIKKLHKT